VHCLRDEPGLVVSPRLVRVCTYFLGPLRVVLLVVVAWVADTDCRKNAILLNLGRVFYNKIMTIAIKKVNLS